MTYRVAYGTDTESLEDPYQIVLLDLPDEVADLDNDNLLSYIDDHGLNEDGKGTGAIPATPMVPWRDILESLRLALTGDGITADAADRIMETVTDAIVNNYFN